MLITLLDLGRNFVGNSFLGNFFSKFRMCFFKVKHCNGHISGMVGPVHYVTLTCDLTHDLDLGYLKVKFRNSCISGIVGLIDVKGKGRLYSLQWRHNGHNSVSNHQPRDCLLSRLFRCRLKNPTKLRFTGLCVGNSPVTGEFPSQRASKVENVSIWWPHHVDTGPIMWPWPLTTPMILTLKFHGQSLK